MVVTNIETKNKNLDRNIKLFVYVCTTAIVKSSVRQSFKQHFYVNFIHCNMKVSGFMVPAEKGITINVNDSLRSAMDLMVNNKIGSLVVLRQDTTSLAPMAILTQTDVLQAFQKELEPDTTEISELGLQGPNGFITCHTTQSRDEVAQILERHKIHHAIVLDFHTKAFAGLVTTFDIAVDCARGGRAWPWIRSEDGRFHKPTGVNDDEPVVDDDDSLDPSHSSHGSSTPSPSLRIQDGSSSGGRKKNRKRKNGRKSTTLSPFQQYLKTEQSMIL